MAHAKPTHISPAAILRVLTRYRRRWIAPAAALTLAAAVYAIVRPDTWQASQALLVRNEAAGSLGEAARFLVAFAA